MWAIVEGRQGNLWIGTDGGGLDRLDPATGSFTQFKNDPSHANSLSHNRVRAIHVDAQGLLWIGTDGGGLNRFDPRSGRWERFTHDPANGRSISSDRVRSLHEGRDGTLWIGTYGGGLNAFDPRTQSFTAFRHDPENLSSLSDDRVYAVFEDRHGAVWVGTYRGGLNRLLRDSATFERFAHDPADRFSLGIGRVRAIFEDRDGILWIGTDGGLNEWRGDRFIRYTNSATDPKSLSDDRVSTIFQDRGGVLWIGTKADGLNRWNPATGQFALIRADPEDPDGLSSDAVASFQYDAQRDLLWVGTFGGGLNRWDRATGRYRHFRHDPGNARSLSDDRVMSLLLDRTGALWVGTYDGGLNRLDPHSSSFTRYKHRPGDPSSLSGNAVMSIHEDSAGHLWIGTFEGGLNKMDRDRGTFVHYRHDPSVPTTLGSNRVTAFCEDSDQHLWIGTDGGGLNRFDRQTGTFVHFHHDPDDPQSLSSDVVWSIHEDASGTLWIGTQGGGLNRWEAEDRRAGREQLKRYTERDGLPNNLVYGILSDDRGHLWLSTNNGLSRFDPQSETFKNFDTAHGLQSNEFNFGAYYRSPTGEMFFGGIKGYNSFFPDRIHGNSHVPPVVLTSFMKLNQEVELAQPISRTARVTLDYTDYVVSFEFAALDYAAPEKNRYAYKLEGFDEDWIELGTTRRATYTNLDAGNYVLRVRGSNNDGLWNEDAVALRVKVLPPPWKTWWAYTLYTIAVGAVIIAYTRAQARKLEREAEYSRKLEGEVQARTRELATRNEELQEANRKLQEASLTDSLTGLRNRRYLMTEIDKSIALTERFYLKRRQQSDGRTPAEADFLFLMIDLDGLKGINDTHGHMAGDRALLQMRDLLRLVCRKSDTIIRWGGDEFLVVGRNMSVSHCERLAERLRSTVSQHEFDLGEARRVRLSCSIGMAMYPFVRTEPTRVHWEQVVTIADRALYLAKTSGRNAWVAIFGTQKTPDENLIPLVQDHTQELLRTGAVELRSSITDMESIVWVRT